VKTRRVKFNRNPSELFQRYMDGRTDGRMYMTFTVCVFSTLCK